MFNKQARTAEAVKSFWAVVGALEKPWPVTVSAADAEAEKLNGS
jgi:hypothetical protein